MDNQAIPVSQTPVVSVVTPAVSPTQPEINKKPGGKKAFVIFIILIALLGGVSFFVFMKFQSNPPTSQIASPTKAVEKQPTQSPAASWKTYSSPEAAYVFQYPPDWDTTSVGPKDLMVAPKEVVANVKKINGGFDGGKFLAVVIHERDEAYPSSVFVSDDTKKVTAKDILVGRLPAKEYTKTYTALAAPYFEAGDITIDVVLLHKDKIYNLELLAGKYRYIFNQILNTFELADE